MRPDHVGGASHLDDALRRATEQALGFIEETRVRVGPYVYARAEEEGDKAGHAPSGWVGLLEQMAADLRGRLGALGS